MEGGALEPPNSNWAFLVARLARYKTLEEYIEEQFLYFMKKTIQKEAFLNNSIISSCSYDDSNEFRNTWTQFFKYAKHMKFG